MPFINIRTNQVVVEESLVKIKTQLGKLIEIIPGKTEAWLMIDVSSEELMYFKGSDDPCAIVEVKTYGVVNDEAAQLFTKKVTLLLEKELQIKANRIYVSYYSTEKRGYSGSNF